MSDKETAPWMREAAAEIWRRFVATFPEVEPASEIGFDKPIAQIIAKHAAECTAPAPQPLQIAKRALEALADRRETMGMGIATGKYVADFARGSLVEIAEAVAAPQVSPKWKETVHAMERNAGILGEGTSEQASPTPDKCPVCGSVRRDTRKRLYHPTEDAYCFDSWHTREVERG